MTSIEKLIEELEGSYSIIARAVGIKKYNEIVRNAIQMHKQEIIDAYHINPQEAKWKNIGINYYNETFKK